MSQLPTYERELFLMGRKVDEVECADTLMAAALELTYPAQLQLEGDDAVVSDVDLSLRVAMVKAITAVAMSVQDLRVTVTGLGTTLEQIDNDFGTMLREELVGVREAIQSIDHAVGSLG